MSARKVCSGMRPSRYHSVRAISAPFRRPETRTLMPSAPLRMVFVTARFIARRNITRFSSCCAMLSATSCASSSGLRISAMLRRTSCIAIFIIFATSPRSFSMSSPFLPITMPGRAVWMVMLTFLAARSMATRLTEASASFLCRKSRTRWSVNTWLGKPRVPAYHFEVQSRVMPRRMPIGLTFCPMLRSRSVGLAVADHDGDVAVALEDAVAATLGARVKALVHRRRVDLDARHLELVDIRVGVVLRIRDRRLEHLAHQARALLGHELERLQRESD